MINTLAISGGDALLKECKPLQWPPRYASTETDLIELYRHGFWSFNGPREQAFAKGFGAYHRARHCTVMMNGTVTLEAALAALGVGPGHEVIVPAVTWVATAASAAYLGALPVFVDVDPETLCMDPDQVEAAITPRTRAIVPVHLYGSMADMDRIMDIARRHSLAVVEDCAHAAGGFWGDAGIGTLGDAGSFSFQESKTMSAGEGGALLTARDELADLFYKYKHIGYPAGERPVLTPGQSYAPEGFLCHNYRSTEFQAVILQKQLEMLGQMTQARAQAADFLRRELSAIPGVRIQKVGRRANPQSYYMFVLMIHPEAFAGASGSAVLSALAAEGLPMKPNYGTVYRHPLWNLRPDQYRIHATGRDALGPCCLAAEQAVQISLPLQHHWLLQPRAVLERTVEAVAKVQRLAGQMVGP